MWRWFCLVQLAGAERPSISADLHLTSPPCAPAEAGEIVVCRAPAAAARLGPRLPDAVEPLLPQAEFRLFGRMRAGIAGEQRSVGGFSAPAATVTVRVPF